MSLLENIDEELLKVSPIAKIPVLTWNWIRWIMRDLLMWYVIEKVYWENAQKVLKADAYNILFSWWLLMQSWWYESIEYKQKIRENMPFLSIFWTALIREMLQWKMKVDFAMLQCKETWKNNNYAISYLKEYFSTRKDDYEGEITEEVKDRSTVQMIYSKMFIQKWCMFDWGISYEHCNEIEESFIHLTLFLLQKHWTIWAMSRAWYWKVDIKYDQELDYQKAIDFIEQKKEDIKEWIHKITK
jgi:tetratricopeptide (TPR) repeat protein